jgi:hypothetical protein
VVLLIEKLSRLYLNRFRKPFQRRDLRITFSRLDTTDLRRVNPAALCDLFLGEPQAFPCLSQFGAEVGHGGDRLRLRSKLP